MCLLLAAMALKLKPAPVVLPALRAGMPQGQEVMEFVQFLAGPDEGAVQGFVQPMAVAFDAGENIYVSDAGLHRILVFNKEGKFLYALGGPGAAYPAPGIQDTWQPGMFNYPYGLDVGEDHRLYVADMLNRRVQVFDLEGRFLDWFPQNPRPGEELFPRDVVMRHNLVYVANPFQVMIYTPFGSFVSSFGKPGQRPGEFWQINGLAVGEDGTIYVSDSMNQRLQAFDPQGRLLWVYPEPGGLSFDKSLLLPRQLALDSSGRIYLANALGFNVSVLTQAGELINAVGERGSRPWQFDQPTGIAVSKGGLVAVAEKVNSRVQIFRLIDN